MSKHDGPDWLMMALAVLAMVASLVGGSVAEVVECSPVSKNDQALYNDWGSQQDPPLEWLSCAETCLHGLRLCEFREMRSPVQLHKATCNGRDVGPPCQLAP